MESGGRAPVAAGVLAWAGARAFEWRAELSVIIASSASSSRSRTLRRFFSHRLSVVSIFSSAAAQPRARRVCRGRRGGAPVPASGSLGRLRRGARPFGLASRGQYRNPEIPKKGAVGLCIYPLTTPDRSSTE